VPNLYHSDVHLPRWKRLLLWLFESPVGQALWMVPIALVAFAPVYWFGLWWPLLIAVAGISFALGWNAARRKMLRGEPVDGL